MQRKIDMAAILGATFLLIAYLLLFVPWARGESCRPQLTCATTPPTANLSAPKVTDKMCRADVCINAAFDVFDNAIDAASGFCANIVDIETWLTGVYDFGMNMGASNYTIRSARCICRGTCNTIASFLLETQAGNDITPDTPLVCSIAGTIPTEALFTTDSDRVIVPGSSISWTVTGPTPDTGDDYLLCVH